MICGTWLQLVVVVVVVVASSMQWGLEEVASHMRRPGASRARALSPGTTSPGSPHLAAQTVYPTGHGNLQSCVFHFSVFIHGHLNVATAVCL